MNFIKKLDRSLLTAIITLLISIIGFVCSSYLISTDLKDIPLGFLLSGGVISLVYVLSYLFVRIDIKRGSSVFSILSLAVRLVLILTTLLLLAFMYYRWDIKLFNIFVFVGIYTASIITFCLSFILLKDGKE